MNILNVLVASKYVLTLFLFVPILLSLKVDVPILPCVFYTFNWLTLTFEMYFVRFHPEVTSCLLSKGKTKYATLGMRLWCKYIRNYLLVYQLTSHFLPYLQNYKEFESEISDLQLEKYGLSFETKKYTTSGWARGGWECDRHKKSFQWRKNYNKHDKQHLTEAEITLEQYEFQSTTSLLKKVKRVVFYS